MQHIQQVARCPPISDARAYETLKGRRIPVHLSTNMSSTSASPVQSCDTFSPSTFFCSNSIAHFSLLRPSPSISRPRHTSSCPERLGGVEDFVLGVFAPAPRLRTMDTQVGTRCRLCGPVLWISQAAEVPAGTGLGRLASCRSESFLGGLETGLERASACAGITPRHIQGVLDQRPVRLGGKRVHQPHR